MYSFEWFIIVGADSISALIADFVSALIADFVSALICVCISWADIESAPTD